MGQKWHAGTLRFTRCFEICVVAVLMLLISGCQPFQAVRNKDRLWNLSVVEKYYSSAVRWGEYDTALSYLRTRNEPAKRIERSFLEKIRVTEYKLAREIVAPDALQVVYTYRISFLHEDSPQVYELVDTQTWWYDEDEGHWFKDGGLPDFAAAVSSP